MKRLAAILFLSILLFNFYGYTIVIALMQQAHDERLVQQLDNENYSEADLISIKTPMNLPYYTNSETYERVNGAIELNGVEYKYVKRRVANDSLELLCLPNTRKQKLQSAKIDFFKTICDLPGSSHGKKTAGVKNILPEFCEEYAFYSLSALSKMHKKYFVPCVQTIPSASIRVEEHPPEQVCLT